MDLIEPRTGMHHIDRDDCLALLAQHQQGVGRLALVEGGKPIIMPVNYAMVEDRVVFLTAPGVKLEAAWRASSVAFEIDEIDYTNRTGWSVVVRGRAEVVTGKSQLFMLKSTPLQPFVAGKETWVMIHPDTITGRRVPFFAELTL